MTEDSLFWATNGTGDGDAGGYTSADYFNAFRSLFTGSTVNSGGVAPDFLDKLAVSGTSSPLSVASGAALVYGVPYYNSTAVNVTVPSPVSQNRIDRIVLRADWTAQTVRVTRIGGTEGAGSAPAMTQSAGSVWDIPLATITVTPGGSITVTDGREFLQGLGDGGIATVKIADSAVTTAKVADNAITNAKMADNSVNTAELVDAAVTAAKVADNAITNAKMADNSVGAAEIVADAVSNAKLANMAQATVKGRANAAGSGDPQDLTAGQLIAILVTADGAGSGLDADTVDGLHASSFWQASNDGAGSGLDADLLDGQQGSYYLPASSYNASDVLTKIKTVDGPGSGLDADLLDGQNSTYYATASHNHIDTAFTTWHTGTLVNCTVDASSAQKSGNLVFFWVRFDVITAGSDVQIPIAATFAPYNFAAGLGSYSAHAVNAYHVNSFTDIVYAYVTSFGNKLYVYGTNLGSGKYEVSGVYRAA